MAAITETELAGLSGAEREAMAGVEDAELNAMQGAGVQRMDTAEDDVPDAVPAVPQAVDGAVPEVAIPVEASAAEVGEVTVAAVTAAQEGVVQEFVPAFAVPAVADFEGKMAALAAREVVLREQLAAGDLDIAAYDAEKTAIIEGRADLRSEQRFASFAAEQNEQNQKARWQWEQSRFFEQDSSTVYKDPILFAALDASIKALAHQPENANKSSSWFLTQADSAVRKLFGGLGAPAQAPAALAKPPPSLLQNIPATLAAVPAAALPETGGGDEFAKLERLSGMDLERQLARMAPDEVTRYLRAA
jgi:hypothetical protein